MLSDADASWLCIGAEMRCLGKLEGFMCACRARARACDSSAYQGGTERLSSPLWPSGAMHTLISSNLCAFLCFWHLTFNLIWHICTQTGLCVCASTHHEFFQSACTLVWYGFMFICFSAFEAFQYARTVVWYGMVSASVLLLLMR